MFAIKYNLIRCYENIHCRIVDVGGQKTERWKWIHCFDVGFSQDLMILTYSFMLVLECHVDYFSSLTYRI
jgi:hypothetical protein